MNSSSLSSQSHCSPELELILDEFLRLWRQGKAPNVEEFAAAHPAFSSEIAELLPALLLAEQLNPITSMSDPILTDERPFRLGAFTLHLEIGRGGMGVVYEAIQEGFNQKLAVKVLRNRNMTSKLQRNRFVREAEAAARLHHPNIVPSKYYGTDANYNYLVMPMIDGISLDRLIVKKLTNDPEIQFLFQEICTDWKKIARLGAQVASALHHAHENGLIHRDIKPANLILDRNGNTWVTDFGLAKLFEEESNISHTGDLIGTPRYMSPEQVFGIPDARSDIYSLGLTLYELLATDWTNNRMRRGMTFAKSSLLELPDLRFLNPDVPETLARVVMKACSHHPESRFQSARELEVSLNQLSFHGVEDRRDIDRNPTSQPRRSLGNNVILMGLICIIVWSLTLFSKPDVPRPIIVQTPPTTQPHLTTEPPVLRPTTFNPPVTNCIVYEEPDSNMINVNVMVCARTDDAEEFEDGEMYLDSTDLELTWDEVDQVIGLRFVGVELPPKVLIHSAKLCFYAERTDHAPTNLRIYGIEHENPKTFLPLPHDITKRIKTKQMVEWNPEPSVRDQLIESPSCKEIVQHLVNHPNWKQGNAIGFIIEGKGNRTVTSYDGNIHYSPMLKVQFEKRPRRDEIGFK